ncbi:MAG: hypothetical protein GY730_00955 [bacterium]|nr:hypothetical protein [bacterium]
MEKRRKGIKNELVQAYKKYLQQTREESIVKKAGYNIENPASDSQNLIKNNFNRLKEECASSIAVLESQYLAQYEQLTELRNVVDVEKNRILKNEAKKWREAFEKEVEVKRETWLKEEAEYKAREEERKRVEKVYQLNLDLWKRDIENFEAKKAGLEMELENKKKQFTELLSIRKRDFEEEIERERNNHQQKKDLFRIEKKEFEDKLELQQKEQAENKHKVEEIELDIAQREQALQKRELLIAKREEDFAREEKVFVTQSTIRRQQEQDRIENERQRFKKGLEEKRKMVEIELEIKKQRIKEEEEVLSLRVVEIEDMKDKITSFPFEIEKMREEAEIKVEKQAEAKYKKALEALRRKWESELKLSKQMNLLLEAQVKDKEAKLSDILERLNKRELTDVVVNSVDSIKRSSDRDPYGKFSGKKRASSFPKIVRPIKGSYTDR